MKNFFILHIEILYAVFHYPIGLPGHLKKIPGLNKHLLFSLFLISLSSAVGTYFLREYYSDSYAVTIIVSTLLHIIFFLMCGFIFGALADAFVARKYSDRAGRSNQMVAIAVLSFLPWLFFLPAAFSARYVAAQTNTAVFVWMWPVVLAIMFWSLFILYVGIRYLYDLTLRDALLIQLKSVAVFMIFPFLLGVLLVQELASLIQ